MGRAFIQTESEYIRLRDLLMVAWFTPGFLFLVRIDVLLK